MTNFEPDPFDANPYAPTTETAASTDDESVRRQHLKHEASVKSIGVLYLLGSFFMIIGGVVVIIMTITDLDQVQEESASAVMIGAGVVYLLLGVFQGWTGLALRRFKPWARIVGIIFSVIGLLAIPVGTLISGYFLYLLISQKGKVVFSGQYQQVIAATPHIKYKTSIIVWIFLGLLLAVFGMGLASALFLG